MAEGGKRAHRMGCPRRRPLGPHSKARNLYRFVEMVVGQGIRRPAMARMWGMCINNLYLIKYGNLDCSQIPRLVKLAAVLKINPYLVFAAAMGVKAEKVYGAMKSKGAMRNLLGV